MSDDNIYAKTWERAADPINKIGYMDGASEGQTSTFQASFDIGYQQGLSFGLDAGLKAALLSFAQQMDRTTILADPRRINCQICVNGNQPQADIVNLYNTQKESNDQHLANLDKQLKV